MEKKRFYKVGITGHRDLVPSQKNMQLKLIKEHLIALKRLHQDKKLQILTSLAEGADRLLAETAIVLKIPFDVILPMPLELYLEDFSLQSQKAFLVYLDQAHSVYTINMYAANTRQHISNPSLFRNYQYRQAGREIVDMSDEMMILSDEKDNQKMGGTSDIANYARACDKILFTIKCDRLCA